VKISRSQLAKILQKVSRALDAAYNELMEHLSREDHLNIDETGHKENGDRYWTWCFRAEAYSFFRIAGTRSSEVLFDILGREFEGVIGCDYFSAYRKYMKDCDVLVQFCVAHVIRDIKYLTTLKSPSTVAYGERLLRGFRRLFRTIHSHDGEDSEALRDRLHRGLILVFLQHRVGFELLPDAGFQGQERQLQYLHGLDELRRQTLLKTFGSIEAIRAASVDELAAAPGMTRPAAEQVKSFL
jgi:hypothetical protein